VALKIVGAGLGRTGTASLKVALEMLGFDRCYHMGEVMNNISAVDDWVAAANGKPDWEKIFDGYAAGVDYPVARLWRELADYYPDAKVLLSVRDPHSWADSVQATIFSPRIREWLVSTPFAEFMQLTVHGDFGAGIDDHDFLVDYFEKHIAEVKATIAPERLLVYQVKEGWAPLCEFLGVDAPDEQFPRVNSRAETSAMIDAMIAGTADADLQASMQERSKELFR
jgi:hypothetical protein